MAYTAPDGEELRALIRLVPSAAYELLLSLGTAYRAPVRYEAWAAQAQAALGPPALAEARYFYSELWHPLALMELPVDYPGPVEDAAGFIDYVAHLDADTFLFYLWGRVIPLAEIAPLRANPA